MKQSFKYCVYAKTSNFFSRSFFFFLLILNLYHDLPEEDTETNYFLYDLIGWLVKNQKK